ncbi:BA75_01867T0 [Komagataella pastoris]|uniref:BA75_01867T0 n=1 Tax=Komagataella pastoris TaxID=4922 RepID=A0A1B2JAS8_PICPA|nr:BA75_01867T0 [Komagataella pastoris]
MRYDRYNRSILFQIGKATINASSFITKLIHSSDYGISFAVGTNNKQFKLGSDGQPSRIEITIKAMQAGIVALLKRNYGVTSIVSSGWNDYNAHKPSNTKVNI